MIVKTKTAMAADKAVGLIRANFCVSRPDVSHAVRHRDADKAIAAIRAGERAKVLASLAFLKSDAFDHHAAHFSTPEAIKANDEEGNE